MLVLEWNQPKITLSDIDTYLRGYLGDNYDGVSVDGSKMSVLTYEVLTPDQEDSIRNWFYSVNDTPATVRLQTPIDREGKPMFVRSMTTTNWHYSSHALDFYTAKHGSLYNRDCDGFTVEDTTDVSDAVLKFYDEAGNELVQNYEEDDEMFQARLTANCTKTCMWWEKTRDYDIAGAHFYVESKPMGRAYLWVLAAPNIPKAWGGRVDFMGRGMNLQMMHPETAHTFFAESCARISYDPVNHSGTIGAEVLHAPGEQIGIQIIYIIYEG